MRDRLSRIARLSPAEAGWRARATAHIVVDRCRTAVAGSRWDRRNLLPALSDDAALRSVRAELAHGRWDAAQTALTRHFATRRPRFVVAPGMKTAVVDRITRSFPNASGDARERGDRLLRGQYDLLGYSGLVFSEAGARALGEPDIDWHYDPVYRRRAPRRFWSAVPYLDPACGDHKIIWELNRHQHWLALGRAYWLTGNREYRNRVLIELTRWLDANPPLVGINWASMLELAFRALSWIWAIELFVDPNDDSDERAASPWLVDLLTGLDRQLTQIERNLSYYFSPNTHLLGEALALYVAGRALPELAASGRRARLGREILVTQMSRQIAIDGGHAERSMHYHRYTLDFYLLALAIACITDDPIAAAFEATVGRLASAARLLANDAGRLPNIGDDDGGMLLPIAGRYLDDIRDSLALAATLVDRPELQIGPSPEETLWMLAHPMFDGARTRSLDGRNDRHTDPGVRRATTLSGALPDTGYYISRSDAGDHLVIDGGAHGYQNGGHAHADALSLTLSIGPAPLLIDPGTAVYTIDPVLRDRMRSTALHNTLELNGVSQSEPDGPFHWRRTASTTVHRWRTTAGLDYFDGAHDGYAPFVHRRRVLSLHGELLVVADFVDGTGDCTAAVHWHLSPDWNVDVNGQSAMLSTASDRITFVVPRGRIERFTGDEYAALGWWSPIYGRREPTTTLRMAERSEAPIWIVSVFDLNPLDPVLGADVLPLWTVAGSLAHGTAVRVPRSRSSEYVLFAEPAGQSSGTTPATWRLGELETDAAMLCARLSADGALTRVAIVDGSFVRHAGRRGSRLSWGRVVPALRVDDLTNKDAFTCAVSPAL